MNGFYSNRLIWGGARLYGGNNSTTSSFFVFRWLSIFWITNGCASWKWIFKWLRASCPSPLQGQPPAIQNSSRRFCQRWAKSLDQCYRSRLCRLFVVACFFSNMGGKCAIHNTQYFPHDVGIAGKQKSKLKKEAQYPFPNGLMGQYGQAFSSLGAASQASGGFVISGAV